MTHEAMRMKRFVVDHFIKLIGISIFFFLVWGGWLFHLNPRIDTEYRINTPYTDSGWLTIGRQGAILTEILFHLRWFNPYFASLMGYSVLCVTSLGMGYYLIRAHQGRNCTWSIYGWFGIICFSHPIMAEMVYFDLQIIQIAWAYMLSIAAAALTHVWAFRGYRLAAPLSMLCMIWAFSTYQTFVTIYIAICAAGYILHFQRVIKDGVHNENAFIIALKIVSLFLASFAINQWITSIWFYSSDYLNYKLSWTRVSLREGLLSVIRYIISSLTGNNSVFHSAWYLFFALGAVICTVINAAHAKEKGVNRWMYLLAMFVLQISPFALGIYLGEAPPIRAQLVYPIVMAFNCLFCLEFCGKCKWRLPYYGCTLLMLVMLFMQVQTTTRLIYTDQVRAKEDVNIIGSIMKEVKLINDDKPVAFIGRRPATLNHACLKGDLIGKSVLYWDTYAYPLYIHSTARIVGAANTLGYACIGVSDESMMERACQVAQNMPTYPATGSVYDAGEFVVVKLSE